MPIDRPDARPRRRPPLARALLVLLTFPLPLVAAIGCVPRAAVTSSLREDALAGRAEGSALPPAPLVAEVAVASCPTGCTADAALAASQNPENETETEGDASDEGGDGDESADAEDEGAEEEGESHDVAVDAAGDGLRYTSDISDTLLQVLWKDSPEKLGSISVGFVDEGRVVNAQQFPPGEGWKVVSPEAAWATAETIEFIMAAIRRVREQFPDTPPLRVNQLSAKNGGWLRPHKSHQSGRDVDLAFYYPTAEPVRVRERERVIDVPRTWALVKALVTETDVQLILVDRRVQKVLHEHALRSGEDAAWLDSIFHGGKDALIKHARRHRDHLHVRFYNARAQELGRRVAPLLAQRPEHNVRVHRVRNGDTLGAIARRYRTTVSALQKANRLRGSFLRLSQVLTVPLRGPCTRCPVPPPVLVPQRRLPPATLQPTSQAPSPNPLAASHAG